MIALTKKQDGVGDHTERLGSFFIKEGHKRGFVTGLNLLKYVKSHHLQISLQNRQLIVVTSKTLRTLRGNVVVYGKSHAIADDVTQAMTSHDAPSLPLT